MKFSDLLFKEILSQGSVHGIVWSGEYHQKICAIKMVILTKIPTISLNSSLFLKMNQNPNQFLEDPYLPYLHALFQQKKLMSPQDLVYEGESLAHMFKCGISPRYYGSFQEIIEGILYGFIVMDRTDCSLKDILIKRELNATEENIIKNMINELHLKHGLIHGDLKPSNIGIYLNNDNTIKKSCFFDCAKIKYQEKVTAKKFNDLIEYDWYVYRKHVMKNSNERIS